MSADPFSIYNSHEGSVKKHFGVVVDAVPPDQPVQGDRMGAPADGMPIRTFLIIVIVLFSVLILRSFYLQIISGDRYRRFAEGNRINTHVIKALRGVIYDRNGVLLVKNVPDFRLQLIAKDLPNSAQDEYEDVLTQISNIAQISVEERDDLIKKSILSGQPVTLRDQIAYTEALALMIQVKDIPGVSIDIFYNREYLSGESFSPFIGYTGKITEEELNDNSTENYLLDDIIGKNGVEKSYETFLRGNDGYRNVEVDYRGVEKSIISDVAPVSGNNLQLTIDSELQISLYEKLKDIVEKNNLPGASAVAIDPRNGGVLALVSYPSYDNNLFVGGIDQESYTRYLEDKRNPLYHRAITGTYPSGSVFKPIVAAAALEENIVTESTTVNSTGGLKIGSFFFPDWKSGGHGITNVTKALADSVNTYFYLIGGGDNETNTGLGVERIVAYARRFGLASPVGIDLPGESAGFLPSKAWKEEFKDEPWYIGDTYHLAIGQGDILVTPLQVATYTATIANGGTFYQPHIVAAITDQDGFLIDEILPTIVNEQVVSRESISVVQRGMREAVESGSARSLQSLPVTTAGKTGTAQFGDPDDKTHSWFTVYAPYDSTPEIALTVLVEEGGGGNDAALPVAREALQEYFSR